MKEKMEMPRQRPRDPELPPPDLAEFSTGVARSLFAIEHLKTAVHDGRRTSVHHQVMNHLGLAGRSLSIIQQQLPQWGKELGLLMVVDDDGSPPRAA